MIAFRLLLPTLLRLHLTSTNLSFEQINPVCAHSSPALLTRWTNLSLSQVVGEASERGLLCCVA